MKKTYGFSDEFVKAWVWCFDFLTVIEPEKMMAGVEYIRSQMQAAFKKKEVTKSEKELFDSFLDDYFIKFWLREPIKSLYNYRTNGRDLDEM